jgi:tripartite-type tricarboxylate transporter receptor subunit TctC
MTSRMRWPAARRRLLVAALAAVVQGPLGAQPAWPWKPVRIIVAYPPGGVSDLVARELADLLAARLGVPILVENRAGASGTLAMERVAGSPADGHVLGFAAVTAVALMATSGRRESGLIPVTPVAGVMRTPVLVAGTPALHAGSFLEMLALARTRPGAIRWATTGTGTTGHTVLERVRLASGAHLVHIPYKGGGQQITDALGGHFEVLSTNVAPQQLDAIRRGRLTALAVGAPARLPALPDVPTLKELGFPEANLDSLFGLFAPTGTPAGVVQQLNREVAAALRNPGLRGTLLAANNTPFAGSAADFLRQVQREAQR